MNLSWIVVSTRIFQTFPLHVKSLSLEERRNKKLANMLQPEDAAILNRSLLRFYSKYLSKNLAGGGSGPNNEITKSMIFFVSGLGFDHGQVLSLTSHAA